MIQFAKEMILLLLLFDPMWWKSGISWIMNVRSEYVHCSIYIISNYYHRALKQVESNPLSNEAIRIRDQNYEIKLLSFSIAEQRKKNVTLLIWFDWFDFIPNQMDYNNVTCANNSISMFAMFAIVFNIFWKF